MTNRRIFIVGLAAMVFSSGASASQEIGIRLIPVLTGLEEPTDIEFLPGSASEVLILEKQGRLRKASLGNPVLETVLTLKVRTESEMGLLGLAFHPRFSENGKIYINYNPQDSGPRRTRISEWVLSLGSDPPRATGERVLLEVNQPYSNHKGGQLLFGKDGFLYIGLGDGGSGGDPQGNAQNGRSLLGKMLRIDVDHPSDGHEYSIPRDNPFVKDPEKAPEIFALGLRNPWRFAFSPEGDLVVADVGQDLWEEIDVVRKGLNYGWNVREGFHCFKPRTGCPTQGFADPILEYGHDQGQCIIGGNFYDGKKSPALRGKYLYGDFVVGKLWAADLKSKTVYSLGKVPIMPSTFGRDSRGEIYVADYRGGTVSRIETK